MTQTSIRESRLSINESHESLRRTMELLKDDKIRQTQWTRGGQTLSANELLVEESRV